MSSLTYKDQQDIRELFHFYRYSQTTLGLLYCVSRQRIQQIINDKLHSSYESEEECLLCGNEEAKEYYIDSNEDNRDPQNKIALCEMDRRRFEHLRINLIKKQERIKHRS